MKKIALILMSSMLLFGCSEMKYKNIVNSDETPAIDETENLLETIDNINFEEEKGLPEEMPEDFDIRYSWWISGKNTLDTYENHIEKDLIINGTEQIEYNPNEAELREIYGILLEYDISGISREMTSAVLTTDDTMMDVEPCTYYDIKFTAGGNTYHVSGDATAWGYRDSDKDAEVFCAFNNEMSKFVRETDEYKALPEPEGAYE